MNIHDIGTFDLVKLKKLNFPNINCDHYYCKWLYVKALTYYCEEESEHNYKND